MSLFAPSAEIEIRDALEANRTVFLVAPRRSGLTHWTREIFQGRTNSARKTIFLEPPTTQGLPSFLASLQKALGVSVDLQTPNDLQTACDRTSACDLVICSIHRLDLEALNWLFCALLDRIGGGTNVRFLVEGSVDVDTILAELFPQGTVESPFVMWSEPTTPWVLMGQLERFIASRARQYPSALMPWVVDHARGDIGLIAEFLERLPRTGSIDDAAITATWQYVEDRGRVSREIRALTAQCQDNAFLLNISSGVVIQDLAPPNMANQAVRLFYVGGVVSYDPMLKSYTVRSPATARILSTSIGRTDLSQSVSRAAIHARTSFLIWRVAAVELQLRALLAGVDWTTKAGQTTCETPWSGRSKKIRSEASREGVDAGVLQKLSGIMDRILPDKITVLEATQVRGGTNGDPPQAMAERLTFAEVVLLTRALSVVHDRLKGSLDKINARRNDIAHFRSIPFNDAMELIVLLDEVQAALACAVPVGVVQ